MWHTGCYVASDDRCLDSRQVSANKQLYEDLLMKKTLIALFALAFAFAFGAANAAKHEMPKGDAPKAEMKKADKKDVKKKEVKKKEEKKKDAKKDEKKGATPATPAKPAEPAKKDDKAKK